jgi:hypothetical protein
MEEKLQFFLSLTFLELWWIAVWGIVYIFIEYMSKKSKYTEVLLYIAMMSFILIVVTRNPDIIPKF